MDLSEARIGKVRSPFVTAPGGSHVTGLGHGRQVVSVTIPPRAENDGVGGKGLKLAGHQITGHDSSSDSVNDHEIQHLAAIEDFDPSGVNLSHHRLIGAEQQLLAGLPATIKCAGNLSSTERTICQRPPILTGKRHTLSDALVDDRRAD